MDFFAWNFVRIEGRTQIDFHTIILAVAGMDEALKMKWCQNLQRRTVTPTDSGKSWEGHTSGLSHTRISFMADVQFHNALKCIY
jgi:hypothetical protein